jgi:hypothetical protein
MASTTWHVNGVSGSDRNNCKSPTTACKTIKHAISLAQAGDSIMVAAATYQENLGITISLKVIGSGAKTTIIDGGGKGTAVTVSSGGAVVTLSNLTIRDGLASYGGGVHNNGALTINNTIIIANTASVDCYGGICGNGGGIYNVGKLVIANSTISGNKALIQCTHRCLTLGGGIFNAGGTVAVNSSTISGNSASCTFGEFCSGEGGGVVNHIGTMRISNSTLSGNSADYAGGILNRGSALTVNSSTISENTGVGIDVGLTATLQNNIVANNSGGNCAGTGTSHGYNLSSDNTCSFNGPGDMNNINPRLGTLGNNGGPTQTIPLLPGSPAIDAGNLSGCTDGQGHLLKTDQRGMPRPDREDKTGCDMGAYELQSD